MTTGEIMARRPGRIISLIAAAVAISTPRIVRLAIDNPGSDAPTGAKATRWPACTLGAERDKVRPASVKVELSWTSHLGFVTVGPGRWRITKAGTMPRLPWTLNPVASQGTSVRAPASDTVMPELVARGWMTQSMPDERGELVYYAVIPAGFTALGLPIPTTEQARARRKERA